MSAATGTAAMNDKTTGEKTSNRSSEGNSSSIIECRLEEAAAFPPPASSNPKEKPDFLLASSNPKSATSNKICPNLLNPLQRQQQQISSSSSHRVWPNPAEEATANPASAWCRGGQINPALGAEAAAAQAEGMSREELRPIFEGRNRDGLEQKSVDSAESDNGQQCRENGLSAFGTGLNFVKGMLGPGCLSIPLIFRQSGLLAGFLLIFLFGLVSTKCMLQLVNCSQHLSKKKRHQFLDYGDVAFEACAQSFGPLRPYKKMARLAVNASIASLQVGICSVSVVFLAAHLSEVFNECFAIQLPQQQWILLLALPLILINFIRSLHKIVVLSIIGSLLMFSALAIIFQYLIRAPHVDLAQLPWVTDLNGVIQASGAVLYAYEGQAMVLPLENKLRRPQQMGGPCGILSWSMGFVSLIYALCGFVGYATYGQGVEGSIALNLPQGQILFTSVRLMLTLVVFFGYVMQQYVIVEMIWPKMRKLFLDGMHENSKGLIAWEMAFRASLVLLSVKVKLSNVSIIPDTSVGRRKKRHKFAIALAVPNLERIIPLVGMSAGMLLAIVFPAFLDTLTFLPAEIEARGEKADFLYRIIQNGLLGIVGLFSLFGGIQANLMDLLKHKG